MRSFMDRAWLQIVAAMEGMTGTRMAVTGTAAIITTSGSGALFALPLEGGLLVGLYTLLLGPVAYRVHDARAERHSPAQRAAEQAAKLQAIKHAQMVENLERERAQTNRRHERRAEHTDWEWQALVADGGVMQDPSRRNTLGLFSPNELRDLNSQQLYSAWIGGPVGYGGSPYPEQTYPTGNSTPCCWCEQYGPHAHTWSEHTRRRH